MTRAQCIVIKDDRILMVRHHHQGVSWWCLPGGAVEPREAPSAAALRELSEECCVQGTILQQTSHLTYAPQDETITFLVEIGAQQPAMGCDPECSGHDQIIIDLQWLRLADIPERDRAFLWAAGLLAVPQFFHLVEGWGDAASYPTHLDPFDE